MVMFKKLAAWGIQLLCSCTFVRYSKTSHLSFIILLQNLLYYKVQNFKNVLTSLRVCTVSDFFFFHFRYVFKSSFVKLPSRVKCTTPVMADVITVLSQNRPISCSYPSYDAFLPIWLVQNAVYYTVL